MLVDSFKIYVDRIREGREELISESLSPLFMDLDEKELQFTHTVQVSGRAYLAGEELVLELNASTKALLPCSVCNHQKEFLVTVPKMQHLVPLKEVKGGIFDFSSFLRESILLEIPRFPECDQGICKNRENLAPYLCSVENKEKAKGLSPFEGLSLEN